MPDEDLAAPVPPSPQQWRRGDLPPVAAATFDRVPEAAQSPTPEGQRSPLGRVLRSRAAIAFAIFLVLAPVYIYYSWLLGLNSGSDTAINILEAHDMANGRPILQGWIQGNNSWLTNELIVYALVAKVVGISPTVTYISHGILYAALVVLTGLLAIGRTQDRKQALLAAAIVGAMMLSITRDVSGWMFLSMIDHLTTAIPLVILFLVLDRTRMSWKLGLASFAILTWALTSDYLVLFIGVLPVAIVAGLRAYFQRENRWAHLSIAAGALLAVPANSVFKLVLELMGGALRNPSPTPIFAAVGEMADNFWETINGLMIVFGAGLMGNTTKDNVTEVLHVAVVATAAVTWVLALRSIRTLSLVDQVLIIAILVNVTAFMFSPMPGPDYTSHELLVVVPFTAALAGRLIPPRLRTIKGQLPVFAGVAVALLLLANAVLGPKAVEPTGELTAWLRQQHLSYGLAGYWQAASVTVESRGEVAVRPVINDSMGHVGPWALAIRDDWYDKTRYDARFVIAFRGYDQTGSIHDLNDDILRSQFGPPERTVRIGDYEVYLYNYNILNTLLPMDQLPEWHQYKKSR
jgi:hypothetical protein